MSVNVTWRDQEWHEDLLARIYEPPAKARALRSGGAVVDVHGGAWARQDRTLGEQYCKAVAAAGFVVVAIEFRDGRVARHPAAVLDIAEAVRWTRQQAGVLDLDPQRVALMGSSSGGHLALHAAITNIEVPFVASFWPPVDPLERYRYAQSKIGEPVPEGQTFDALGLVKATEAYFGDQSTMGEASISTLLRDGKAEFLPPVWLAQAGADLNVPSAMIDELVAEYALAGGQMELTEYEGEVHGFGHRSHVGAVQFHETLVQKLIAALG